MKLTTEDILRAVEALEAENIPSDDGHYYLKPPAIGDSGRWQRIPLQAELDRYYAVGNRKQRRKWCAEQRRERRAAKKRG